MYLPRDMVEIVMHFRTQPLELLEHAFAMLHRLGNEGHVDLHLSSARALSVSLPKLGVFPDVALALAKEVFAKSGLASDKAWVDELEAARATPSR